MKKLFTLLLIHLSIISIAQNFQWAKSIGGLDRSEIYAMTIDGLDNVYCTGYFHGDIDFDPISGNSILTSSGGHDIFVSKHDNLGNFIWAKNFGGGDIDVGFAIAVDDSGNVYCGGTFNGDRDFDPGPGIHILNTKGSQDIFISKFDPLGNFVWAKSMGGINYDECRSLNVDRSGNVYLTGFFSDTVDFDPGTKIFNLTSNGRDGFISKLDGSGNFIWAKQLGGYGFSIIVDNSRNVYTTGHFIGTADFDPGSGNFNLTSTGYDIFISKLDSLGNFVWAKKMGGAKNDVASSMVVDDLGHIYTSGYFTEKADFDPGNDTFNLDSEGGNAIFISKLSADGDFIWAKHFGINSNIFQDRISAIACDKLGNIYLTGYFDSSVDFDPDSGTSNITSRGFNDIFILKLTASGNLVWANSLGGNGDDKGYSIAVDPLGSIYTAGSFTDISDFDPSSKNFILRSLGETDIFISKLGKTSVEIKELPDQNNFSLFPNPATNQINVRAAINLGDANYRIYDHIGRLVLNGKLNSEITSIEISHLSLGIYLLIVEDHLTQTFKVMKQ